MALSRRTSFSYPRQWNPLQVPTFPVEVDTTHPLAQGLLAAFIPGGAKFLADLCGNSPPFSAAGTLVQTSRGTALNVVGGSMPTAVLSDVLKIQSGTITHIGKLLAAPSNDCSLFTTNYGSLTFPGSSPYTNYGLFYNSGVSSLSFAYGGGGGYNYLTPSIPWNAVTRSLSCSFTANSGGIALYTDGVVATTATAVAGAIPYTGGDALWLGGDSRTINSVTHAGFIHGKVLSPDLIAWMDTEPFAMLRPVVRRQFYVGSTVTLGPLTGSAVAATVTSGTLRGIGNLSGTLTEVDTATVTQSSLSGSAVEADTATGILKGIGALVGAEAAAVVATATLHGIAPITGSAVAAFVATGTLGGIATVVGSEAAAFVATGTLVGSGALVGSAAAAFTTTGSVGAPGTLTGSSAAAFVASGTLQNALTLGPMSGAAVAAFLSAATLKGTGNMVGSSACFFSISGHFGNHPHQLTTLGAG